MRRRGGILRGTQTLQVFRGSTRGSRPVRAPGGVEQRGMRRPRSGEVGHQRRNRLAAAARVKLPALSAMAGLSHGAGARAGCAPAPRAALSSLQERDVAFEVFFFDGEDRNRFFGPGARVLDGVVDAWAQAVDQLQLLRPAARFRLGAFPVADL